MVGVGRALCWSPSPTPCPSRVTQSRLHSTASRWVWNISREGDSTASLGSLGQGSVTLRGKKFSPSSEVLLIGRVNSLHVDRAAHAFPGSNAHVRTDRVPRGWVEPAEGGVVPKGHPLPFRLTANRLLRAGLWGAWGVGGCSFACVHCWGLLPLLGTGTSESAPFSSPLLHPWQRSEGAAHSLRRDLTLGRSWLWVPPGPAAS